MQLTCETAELNKAVQSIMPAVASKPSTPIFAGMHLIASEGVLRLESTDMSISMKNEVKADVTEEGDIVINASRFNDMVRSMNGETVSIKKAKGENNVRLQSGKADYKVLIMNSDDFPPFPAFDPNRTFSLEDEKVKELIKKTAFACSTDAARPIFTGVLCEVKDGRITFVGTNTHRLSICGMPVEGVEDTSIIIPAGILKEIAKNLNSKVPQEVKFSLLNNQLMVTVGSLTIISRLIEGSFPDFRKVIPASFNTKTVIKKEDLAGAVGRMSLCSGNESDYSIIKLSIGEKEIKVMSSSPDVGTGEEKIPCATEGGTLNVAFNATYIMDVMKCIESEDVVMRLNNSLGPVSIQASDDEDYIYIVTPVRVIF